MATLTVDVVYGYGDESLDDVLKEAVAGLDGVTATVLQERGLGGSWPEVEFTGSREALKKLALWYNHSDSDPGLDFIISSIKD